MSEVDDRKLISIHSKNFEKGDHVYCCRAFPNYENLDLLGFLKEVDHKNKKALFHPYLERTLKSVWVNFTNLKFDHWSLSNNEKYKWKMGDPILMMGGCIKHWED